MENEKHLAILRQGVDVWNEWRRANPQIKPDLRRLSLSSYLHFRRGPRAGAKHPEAIDFTGANFRGANLCGVSLAPIQARGQYYCIVGLTNVDLTEAELRGVDFTQADLRGAILIDADLSGANLDQADLRNANLSKAFLKRAQLLRADLEGAILTGACIEDWNINNGTNLDGVTCDYIYLKATCPPGIPNYAPRSIRLARGERFPLNVDFLPEEFAILFRADRSPLKLFTLQQIIKTFENLLNNNPQGHESLFHEFLKENTILLDIYGETVVSKPRFYYPPGESPLGKEYVEPDFIIKYPGNKYKLVELERPGKRIGTNKGHSTSQITQATFQIAEWDNFIKEHYNLIKDEYPAISTHCSYMVVIGTRTEATVGGRDPEQYMRLIASHYSCEVCFYDELLDKAKLAYSKLEDLNQRA